MSTETPFVLQIGTVERSRPRFFLGAAVALLLINLIGFAPTLYLRPLFDVQPRPAYLMLHGAIFTGWFLLLVVQASLVGMGRVSLHRRLGVAGAVLAMLIVFAGLLAQLSQPARLAALGMTQVERLYGLFWVNMGVLLIFATYTWIAFRQRRNAEVHKRLLLLATINMMGPAIARIARFPIFGGTGGDTLSPLESLIALGSPFALMLVVVACDLIVNRRVHTATWLACVGIVLARIAGIAISLTDFGQAVVRATL